METKKLNKKRGIEKITLGEISVIAKKYNIDFNVLLKVLTDVEIVLNPEKIRSMK